MKVAIPFMTVRIDAKKWAESEGCELTAEAVRRDVKAAAEAAIIERLTRHGALIHAGEGRRRP